MIFYDTDACNYCDIDAWDNGDMNILNTYDTDESCKKNVITNYK